MAPLVDVSHLSGRTTEAQRMQGDLIHSAVPISPLARRQAAEAKQHEAMDVSQRCSDGISALVAHTQLFRI